MIKVNEEKINGSTELIYNDKIGPRERKAYLILIKDGRAYPFTGVDIAGVVAILGCEHHKDGKWSNRDWRLLLAPGVTYKSGREDFNSGHIVPGVVSWAEAATKLGCSVASVREVVRHYHPWEAEELDDVEAKVAEVDDMSEAAEVRTLSFGSPSNRAIR